MNHIYFQEITTIFYGKNYLKNKGQLRAPSPTTLAIIFWQFTVFQYRIHSPQAESELISTIKYFHCIKSIRFLSLSGPYFPAFGLHSDSDYSVSLRIQFKCECGEKKYKKNSKYGHFSRVAKRC